MSSFEEGPNTIVVNQMGSSDTIFRSSNEISWLKPLTEQPENTEEIPVDDTVENTPSSIDKAVNGNRSDESSESESSESADETDGTEAEGSDTSDAENDRASRSASTL